MLYIQCKGEIPKGVIIDVNSYFNRHKTKEWFNRKDVQDIIYDIDKTTVYKDECLDSPVFGFMSPDRLSGGCKALILMLVDDLPVYATKCGDNCFKWITKIAEEKDVHIVLHHCPEFPEKFDAIMEDTGEKIHNDREWVNAYYRIRHNR